MASPRTSIARIMICTGIIAVGVSVVPLVYNTDRDRFGDILSLLMIAAVLIGGLLGVLLGGVDWMFRGVVLAALVYFVAATILMVLSVLAALMGLT